MKEKEESGNGEKREGGSEQRTREREDELE